MCCWFSHADGMDDLRQRSGCTNVWSEPGSMSQVKRCWWCVFEKILMMQNDIVPWPSHHAQQVTAASVSCWVITTLQAQRARDQCAFQLHKRIGWMSSGACQVCSEWSSLEQSDFSESGGKGFSACIDVTASSMWKKQFRAGCVEMRWRECAETNNKEHVWKTLGNSGCKQASAPKNAVFQIPNSELFLGGGFCFHETPWHENTITHSGERIEIPSPKSLSAT